jgi:hypothetical protein
VKAEDLDMQEITCALQIRGRTITAVILMVMGDDDGDFNDDPRDAEHASTSQSQRHAQSARFEPHNIPNSLLHSAKGIHADSNGQSKRLSMSGQPRGPGGSGKADARRRWIRNAAESIATRT